jgi:Fe-S-cluster containining protein
MNPDLRNRVLEIYAEVNAAIALASPRCDASGRCCRFAEYKHTLFLSHFEAEILLDTAPAFSKPASSATCPFQVNNLCTARDERPLGCRIYFCDPAFQEQQSTITEVALKKLKQLADEFGTGWRYAPLHVFLNETTRPQDEAVTKSESRISLPLV